MVDIIRVSKDAHDITNQVDKEREVPIMLYRLYVNQIYIMCSDQEDSVEEFIDMYISIINDMMYDNFHGTDVDRATDKLNNGEYTTATDTKLNITDIYVTI